MRKLQVWKWQVLEFAGTGTRKYGVCEYGSGRYWNLQATENSRYWNLVSKEIAGMEITGTLTQLF